MINTAFRMQVRFSSSEFGDSGVGGVIIGVITLRSFHRDLLIVYILRTSHLISDRLI